MSGIKVGKGVYTYQRDFDKQGTFYWIISPIGERLAFVEYMWMVRRLLSHLNRSES